MPRPSFRVLTVNAHKGFGFFNRRFILRELRDAVRTVSADVVFLQEVIGAHAHHARKYVDWPETPQYEYLADTMWPDHAYGRNAVYPHGDHGNAVLSRFPIRSYTNHDASLAGDEGRGLLHCEIDLSEGGAPLHAICVHLGLSESHRKMQIQQLCNLIHGLPPAAPLVIAGDFNDWRLFGHDKLLACCGVREVFAASKGVPARTFPARWPLLRLDRIYARNARAMTPVALPARPWSHLSDHAPLAAEIRV